MCGPLEKVAKVFGLGGDSTTTIVQQAPAQIIREKPVADQRVIEDKAASRAQQDSSRRRRRLRASSLLETGGDGDPNAPLTAMPAAVAGKPTLGA